MNLLVMRRNWLPIPAACILVLATDPVGAGPATRTFDVRDFGAAGNGTNLDTVAFQKALDTRAVSGGAEVTVPAGHYLIGSMLLQPCVRC
jgi:hypothetical protein